jgi:hypothetical protein
MSRCWCGRNWLRDAAELVDKRLVTTTGFTNKPTPALSEYERGIRRALDEVLALLREEGAR